MTEEPAVPKLRYRVLCYAGGTIFAITSYIAGVWAYGVESASWGQAQVYQALMKDLDYCFRSHMLTLFIWEVICVAVAGAMGYLLDRETFYRHQAEQRANIDGVTEIYNHRYFQERLNSEIERASRYDHTLSVILLDLDNFKSFNDSWGHQEGDRLLKWFASVCSQCVRTMDVLARYGGEEFIVILPETGYAEALTVAERIREAAEKQNLIDFDRSKGVTVSAGVATYPLHANSRHALILCADAALYSAKHAGKNRCVTYNESCNRLCHTTTAHVEALLATDDLSAIEALAGVIDARDWHMRGHSHAVMQMSVALGYKLGMTAGEIDDLRSAALLHDLGKIGTPEEVLGKKAPLNDAEHEQIRSHAYLGAQILKRVQQMNSILPGVKHHHERFDGKGYPNGLTGEGIPLLARVIAIADAYDAMTSPRSYKASMSPEQALVEIQHCAGSQFDPELVRIFVEVMQMRQDEAA
jgi:diguanylate cyclase (GGDEF)-like protein/putative nucleotidyltransferase with HDIG domain